VRTFHDLRPRQLRIIASDITQGKLLVLPDDMVGYNINPAHLEVAKAVRMSCSIPYFFDPVRIRKQVRNKRKIEKFHKQFYYIVDGGLLSNFPLWLFDQSHEQAFSFVPTLGFQLVGKNENQPNQIFGPISMLQALFETMMNAHDERYIEKHNDYRTVKIPTMGVGTAEFNISPEKSLALFEAGKKAGNHFFKKWSLESYNQMYGQFEKQRQQELQKMMRESQEYAAMKK